MERLHTFWRGGIHPHDMKALSGGNPIERIPYPEELVIPLCQHIGAPAKLLKQKGDTVVRGEIIGEAASFVSANIHSPVSGLVQEIRKVTLATGMVSDAVVIIPDARQAKLPRDRIEWHDTTARELLEKIKDYGVVGMGGATFPTHVKLSIPEGKKADFLVINGVECEPYLTADYRVMLEVTDQVLEGIMILKKIIHAEQVIIGIEKNKLDAAAIIQQRIAEKQYPIQVKTLKIKFPQGDEKMLLKATTGRVVPAGKLPIDIGAVVCNISTCYAVYEAVVFEEPLIERVITVTGSCIKEPKNVLAPVGTKVSDLIAFCGGFTTEPERIILGGPMMGFAIGDLDTPVIKGTGGILALSAEKKKVPRTPCISCGRCVIACPFGLHPTELFKHIEAGRYKEAMESHLMDCKECGCCTFVCPARIPLVQGFKTGKRLGRKA